MRVFPALSAALAVCGVVASAQLTFPPAAPGADRATSAPQGTVDGNPPPLKPVPKLSDAEMEQFLKTAQISTRTSLTTGTTNASKATLTDGKLTHDAQVQCIDTFKPLWKGAEGTVEKNFRDTWKFNVAAYRVGRLIGLKNIPMSVERQVEDKQCSVTWWVDNVWMVEADRREKGIKPPATDDWVNQLNQVRVFDQLIYNTDRNQGNLLITPDWQLWMIDHTRAFRTYPQLMKVESLRRVDKQTLEALKKLKREDILKEAGPWLRPEEISSILVRRDLILKFFQNEIQNKGEESVLTGLPRKTPAVSVP